MEKPELKIWFSDFPPSGTVDGPLKALLSRRYTLRLTETDPDYVIYSVFGTAFLSYPDPIRILYTAENIRPDFNLCDYAFSFDWLTYEDRHFRTPNYFCYPQWEDVLARGASDVRDLSDKPDFCNFIYSNGNGDPIRDEFFHALNARQRVESYGRHLRNCDRTISPPYQGDWSTPKVESQRSFRFSIAFENTETPGYTTEKLMHALAADTIPIYWGDPAVARVFNPDRFVDVRALGVQGAVERVMELESNPAELLETLNKPFFSEQADLNSLSPDAILDAFARIFDAPLAEARRRNRLFWGKIYEDRRVYEVRCTNMVNRYRRFTPASLAKRVARTLGKGSR